MLCVCLCGATAYVVHAIETDWETIKTERKVSCVMCNSKLHTRTTDRDTENGRPDYFRFWRVFFFSFRSLCVVVVAITLMISYDNRIEYVYTLCTADNGRTKNNTEKKHTKLRCTDTYTTCARIFVLHSQSHTHTHKLLIWMGSRVRTSCVMVLRAARKILFFFSNFNFMPFENRGRGRGGFPFEIT